MLNATLSGPLSPARSCRRQHAGLADRPTLPFAAPHHVADSALGNFVALDLVDYLLGNATPKRQAYPDVGWEVNASPDA
jgi:hypothetical protein